MARPTVARRRRGRRAAAVRWRRVSAGVSAADRNADVAELTKLSNDWDEAIVAKRRGGDRRQHGGGFPHHRRPRQRRRARQRSSRDIMDPKLTIDPYTVEDFEVRLYGDTALLSGRTLHDRQTRRQAIHVELPLHRHLRAARRRMEDRERADHEVSAGRPGSSVAGASPAGGFSARGLGGFSGLPCAPFAAGVDSRQRRMSSARCAGDIPFTRCCVARMRACSSGEQRAEFLVALAGSPPASRVTARATARSVRARRRAASRPSTASASAPSTSRWRRSAVSVGHSDSRLRSTACWSAESCDHSGAVGAAAAAAASRLNTIEAEQALSWLAPPAPAPPCRAGGVVLAAPCSAGLRLLLVVRDDGPVVVLALAGREIVEELRVERFGASRRAPARSTSDRECHGS